MNKKLLTIFLSLFLVVILSVSCSNKDKTGSSGIEQYNGNSYVSTKTFNYNSSQVYLWVSIKDSKVVMTGDENNTSEPSYPGYMNVTGSGTDYNFYSGIGDAAGTLKFASDGSSVTVRFTKNTQANDIVGQNIVCNKK